MAINERTVRSVICDGCGADLGEIEFQPAGWEPLPPDVVRIFAVDYVRARAERNGRILTIRINVSADDRDAHLCAACGAQAMARLHKMIEHLDAKPSSPSAEPQPPMRAITLTEQA